MQVMTFDPHFSLSSTEIVLVGVGGTGSILARHIARMVYHMQAMNLSTPHGIRFVDPDIIEEKNVGRQMFTHADIGQPKAQVIATRLNMALGLDIEYAIEPFCAETHLKGYSTILLGAVDNHLARRELAKPRTVAWIDSGNNRSSGQVVIGNTSDRGLMDDMFHADYHARVENSLRHLPNAALIFPDLLEPDPDETPQADEAGLSCADLLMRDEQHLFINDMMASVAANYLYKLLYRQPINTFMTFCDLEGLTMRSVPITADDLTAYLPERTY